MLETALRRDIRFSGVFNFRDVGGYPTRRGRRVRWRRLFRSDALSGLSDEDRDRFLTLAVRTVVDLRRPAEVEDQGAVPNWGGLVCHHIDPGHREWTEVPYQGTDPARYLADRYRDLAEEGAGGLAEAIGVIADEATAPALVQCVTGKDRTGVVCSLTLALLGVSDDDIDADYARSSAANARYAAWVRSNRPSRSAGLPGYSSPRGTMKLFLSELRERHHSVEEYLARAGLDATRVSALRANLLVGQY